MYYVWDSTGTKGSGIYQTTDTNGQATWAAWTATATNQTITVYVSFEATGNYAATNRTFKINYN